MTEGELATVSTIEPSRLHNIMINNVKKISVREVVAIALGLGMQPEEIFEFVKKSSAKFEDNYDDFLLQMLIKRKYMWSVPTFNAALVKMNQPPLVEDWRTAESRRKKKSTVTT
jgi:DNA-binding Xre family transcriptional regulator